MRFIPTNGKRPTYKMPTKITSMINAIKKAGYPELIEALQRVEQKYKMKHITEEDRRARVISIFKSMRALYLETKKVPQ